MGKIVRNGVTYGGSSTSAENVAYDNTDSGLEAVVVQDAIDELKANDVGRFEKDNQGDILGEIFNTYTGNNKNVANGEYSHAEGFHTTASSFSSHAEGDHTTASGYASHAGGYETIATARYQTVIGKYNIADIIPDSSDAPIPQYHLFIIGNGDSSNRSNIVEVTDDTFNVNGDITAAGNTLIMQYETLPPASQEVSNRIVQYIGSTYEDDIPYVHGCFYECISNEENPPTYSWKEINYEKVGHLDESSFGGEIFNIYEGDFKNTASGDYSHAEGYETTASAYVSHAEGRDTIASGGASHAEGRGTEASGEYSHAEGQSTIASGSPSHAEGRGTEASGGYSHAEGYGTIASGSPSHAEGLSTIAIGGASHAEGVGATARGYGSHAGGHETIATAQYQTVIGKYNIADIIPSEDSGSSDSDSSDSDSDTPVPQSPQHLFIIGNGESNSNRSNIVEVTEDTLNVNGDITVAGKPLVVQCDTMSTADEYLLGRIVQYVGATDANYTHGCFYECISDGEEPPTYSWQITKVIKFDTTPTSGSANAVTSDGMYNLLRKGTTQSSVSIGSVTNQATGSAAVSMGYYTKAPNNNMVAMGVYNDPKAGYIFTVGNGADSSHRNNILEATYRTFNVNGDIKKNNVSLPTPYTTMPTITEAMLGQIAMYVGETTNDYVKGYFYIASSDGAVEPTYSWVSMVDNVPTSGSKNFVTSGAVKTAVDAKPGKRGAGSGSVDMSYQGSATGKNAFSANKYTGASGENSASFNNWNIASQTDSFACGRFNAMRSGDLFNIGNGTANNARSNILEANSTSVNINGGIQRDGIGIDDYTTTERKIGKWIDGSDLYQRTFEVTGLVNGQWNSNVLGTSGINIVDVQGWIDWTYNSEPNCRTNLNYYANSSDYVSLANTYTDLDVKPNRTDAGMAITNAVITIKYTKPSAQANLMQTATTEEVSENPTVEEDDMR